MKKQIIVAKGSLVLMSKGEYDSYHVKALGRATADIDVNVLREEYLAAHPKEHKPYKFQPEAFISWLISVKGLIGEENFIELWASEYRPVITIEEHKKTGGKE